MNNYNIFKNRPDLGWRDIQQLIVDNAEVVNINDEGWKKNGAGHYYHHNYGFGNMNAEKLVDASIEHKLLPKSSLTFSKEISPRLDIPLDSEPIESEIILSSDEVNTIASLEHVQVTVKILHKNRRYLTIKLISPSGTTSLLSTKRPDDDSSEGFNPWTFMTVFNWGESPIGSWKLIIVDDRKSINNSSTKWKVGKLVSWKLSVNGVCSSEFIAIDEANRPYCTVQPSNKDNYDISNEKSFLNIIIICSVGIVLLLIIYKNKEYFIKKLNGSGRYILLDTYDSSNNISGHSNEEMIILNELKSNDVNKKNCNYTLKDENKELKKQGSVNTLNKNNFDNKNGKSSIFNNNNNNNNNTNNIKINAKKKENFIINPSLYQLKTNNKCGMIKSWSVDNLQERKFNTKDECSPVVDDSEVFKFCQQYKNLEKNKRNKEIQGITLSATSSLKNSTTNLQKQYKKSNLKSSMSSRGLNNFSELKQQSSSQLKKSNSVMLNKYN